MGAKILIVSDSPTQCMALQQALVEREHEIITARDGLAALNCVYKEHPSIVVSDIVLPHLNGYQLCRLVKNDPHTSQVSIILLTTLDQKIDSFWGLEAGADLYLKKQGDPSYVVQAVRQVLDEKRPPAGEQPGMSQVFAPLFSGSDAQARLAALLDQLLFKTTVRGAVRLAAREMHDRQSLYRRIFELLRRMFDYGLAVLAVQGQQGVKMIVDVQTALPTQSIHALSDAIQDRQEAEGANWQKLQIDVFDPELVSDEAPSFTARSQASTRFEIDERAWCTLALYSVQENKYDDETRAILDIIGDELVLVLRSLARYDEVEQMKADFTAMLVHDLRSPLVSIIGFSELLQMNPEEPLSEWQGDRVERVVRKGKEMLNIVNDLLEFSKLEAGHMTLSLAALDVGALLTQVKQDMNATAGKVGVTISLDLEDDLPAIQADKFQMERVVTNLVSNAIKFTPPEGRISISARRQLPPDSSETSGFVMISVADTGAGIPQHEIDKVFGKYEQFHGSRFGGTGLGLAICKQIVEAHQGRIWLESQPGKGTTFTLLLPVEGPRHSDRAKPKQENPPPPAGRPTHETKPTAQTKESTNVITAL